MIAIKLRINVKIPYALYLLVMCLYSVSVSAVNISGNATLVSDYVFRGVNLSAEEPAIQGGFDINQNGFYAGVWASSDSGSGEFDLYGGYTYALTESVALDVGITRYYYPIGGSTTEFYAGINWQALGLTYYYDETLEQDYLELSAGFSLTPQLALDLRAGQVSPEVGEQLYDASVTFTYAFDDTYAAFAGFTTHEADSIDNYFIVGVSGIF